MPSSEDMEGAAEDLEGEVEDDYDSSEGEDLFDSLLDMVKML